MTNPPTLITWAELKTRLGINQSELTALVRRGLPHQLKKKSKRFDPHAVRAWLLAQNLAEDAAPPAPVPDVVLDRAEDAAQALGVSARRLLAWSKMEGFPGHAGQRGLRVAHYPLEAIRAWRADRFGLEGQVGDLGLGAARLESVQEATRGRKLRNDQIAGRLYDADQVEQRAAELFTWIRDQLLTIPDELAATLPARGRVQARQDLEARVRQLLAQLASWRPADDSPGNDGAPPP